MKLCLFQISTAYTQWFRKKLQLSVQIVQLTHLSIQKTEKQALLIIYI